MRKEGKPKLLKRRKKMEAAGRPQPVLDKIRNTLDPYENIIWQAYQNCGTSVSDLIGWLNLYSFSNAEKIEIISIINMFHGNISE